MAFKSFQVTLLCQIQCLSKLRYFPLISYFLGRLTYPLLKERSIRYHCKPRWLLLTFRPEKFVRSSRDVFYNAELHHLSKKGVIPPPVYSIDNLDHAWLATVNEERARKKEAKVLDWMLEDVIEASEQICLVKMLAEALANGINEESKCDVCRGVGYPVFLRFWCLFSWIVKKAMKLCFAISVMSVFINCVMALERSPKVRGSADDVNLASI